MLGNEREIWIPEISKPFKVHEQKNIYTQLIAELWSAKRACGAPWVRKCGKLPIRENLVITWPYTDRPSVRTTGIPIFTLTLSSYFGSSKSSGENWLHINVVISWQLSKQGIRWPVSQAQVSTHPGRIFLKLFADKLLVFRWSQAQVYFLKFIWNMLCLCHYGPALLTFWFQTDLESENSASYLKMQAGNTDVFLFSHHSHALVTLHVQFLYQVSSCGKFIQHLETCLLWQLKLTEFCDNLWCF